MVIGKPPSPLRVTPWIVFAMPSEDQVAEPLSDEVTCSSNCLAPRLPTKCLIDAVNTASLSTSLLSTSSLAMSSTSVRGGLRLSSFEGVRVFAAEVGPRTCSDQANHPSPALTSGADEWRGHGVNRTGFGGGLVCPRFCGGEILELRLLSR